MVPKDVTSNSARYCPKGRYLHTAPECVEVRLRGGLRASRGTEIEIRFRNRFRILRLRRPPHRCVPLDVGTNCRGGGLPARVRSNLKNRFSPPLGGSIVSPTPRVSPAWGAGQLEPQPPPSVGAHFSARTVSKPRRIRGRWADDIGPEQYSHSCVARLGFLADILFSVKCQSACQTRLLSWSAIVILGQLRSMKTGILATGPLATVLFRISAFRVIPIRTPLAGATP
jgi:hypothetical protein